MNDCSALVHLTPIGALALLLAAGCTASGTAGRAAGSGDELLLTSSLSGEQCRIRNTSVATGARRLEQFEIGCAGWEEPSGFI